MQNILILSQSKRKNEKKWIPWFEMLFVILLLNTNRKVYKFQNDKMHSLHNYSYSKNSSIALLKCFNWFLCATYIFNCILLHSLSIKSYAIRLKLFIKTFPFIIRNPQYKKNTSIGAYIEYNIHNFFCTHGICLKRNSSWLSYWYETQLNTFHSINLSL
jgi:hypothetical protein